MLLFFLKDIPTLVNKSLLFYPKNFKIFMYDILKVQMFLYNFNVIKILLKVKWTPAIMIE